MVRKRYDFAVNLASKYITAIVLYLDKKQVESYIGLTLRILHWFNT